MVSMLPCRVRGRLPALTTFNFIKLHYVRMGTYTTLLNLVILMPTSGVLFKYTTLGYSNVYPNTQVVHVHVHNNSNTQCVASSPGSSQIFKVAHRETGEPGSQNHVTNAMPVQSIEPFISKRGHSHAWSLACPCTYKYMYMYMTE